MTRQEQPPNVVGVAFWVAGTIAVLVALLLWSHPELWPWVVAVWAGCAILGLGIVAAEAVAAKGAAEAELERRDREDMAPWERGVLDEWHSLSVARVGAHPPFVVDYIDPKVCGGETDRWFVMGTVDGDPRNQQGPVAICEYEPSAHAIAALLNAHSNGLDAARTTTVPLIPFDSLPKAEREHINRPDLRIVQSPIPMQRRGDEWDAIVRAVEREQP